MKACPFCAEDVLDAAIVCKHCRRDLITPTAATSSPRPGRWRTPALILGALVAIGFGMVYFGADHQRFLAFEKQRDAWHRKCDAYVGTTPRDLVSAAATQACQEELTTLTAYAKRQGW